MESESRKEGDGESHCISSCATPSSQRIFPPILLCYPALYLLLFLLSSFPSFSFVFPLSFLSPSLAFVFSSSRSFLCSYLSLSLCSVSFTFPRLPSPSPPSIFPHLLFIVAFPFPRLPLHLPLLLIPYVLFSCLFLFLLLASQF